MYADFYYVTITMITPRSTCILANSNAEKKSTVLALGELESMRSTTSLQVWKLYLHWTLQPISDVTGLQGGSRYHDAA